MLRHCYTCARFTFCEHCTPNRAPPASVHVWQCRMCPRKALWCSEHCSEMEVMAHLCRHHYDLHTKCCTHCMRSQAGLHKEWMPCRTVDCTHEIYACNDCVSNKRCTGLICETCWINIDKLCIVRGEKHAQCCQIVSALLGLAFQSLYWRRR